MLEFIWFFTTAGGQWISFHPLPNEDGDLRLWYRGWSSRRTCNNLFEWEVASRRTTLPQFILLGFSQPESFQSTLRTSMMFSYFLLLLDIAIIILLRRYSDYYVLRASFILLNLVCYVWLGFSSHWIALWSISNLWNAWRDVKLVLLVFTCGFGQTIFNCSRTHHFTGTVSNEATSDMGYPPGRTCDPISVFYRCGVG